MNPWTCLLCAEPVPATDIISGHHARIHHPDWDADPEHWPDGGLVILDDTPWDEP